MNVSVLRDIGFYLMFAFTLLALVFLVGEIMVEGEPGGRLIALVGVFAPIVGISAWAWFSPKTVRPYLWVSVVVIVAVAAWWAIAPGFWDDIMEQSGPVIPVASIIAAAPIALWGWRERSQTRSAGIMLLIVSLTPIIGVLFVPDAISRGIVLAVGIMIGPYAVGGLLYLLAGSRESRLTYPKVTMSN